MIYIKERLVGYDARLLLTVHDEVVVEAGEGCVDEVKDIVEHAVIDGFGEFFKLVKMKADAKVGDCWLK